MSDVVAGVEFATNAAKQKALEAKADPKSTHRGSVANMSLGGGKSPALDRAVNGAVDSGIHFAVAAGNDNKVYLNFFCEIADTVIDVSSIRTLAITPQPQRRRR
jgi:cerevisin